MPQIQSNSINKVWLPQAGHFAHFIHRDKMRAPIPLKSAFAVAPWPQPTLPINNYGTLVFPMYGNDSEGDCGEAMICKADNTWTGMNGNESVFNETALIAQYNQYSGGDNGLTEQDVIAIGKAGIAGNKSAIIYDALDIDPTNTTVMQAAIQQYGGVCFAFAVPDSWINSFNPNGGAIWDAPAVANPNNGHFIWINGADAQGRYRGQTWGSWVWLTPAGVLVCQPSAFVLSSPRWYNPNTGLNPYGKSYNTQATLWVSVGGNTLPNNPFPNPTPTPVPVPPNPTPTPTPVPEPTRVPTSLALQFTPNPPTVIATIVPQTNGGVPTGTVVFDVDNYPNTSQVTLVNRVASLDLSKLAAGQHGVGAGYKGDDNFAPSTDVGLSFTISTPTPTPTPVPIPPTPTVVPGLTLAQTLSVINHAIEANHPYFGNVVAQVEAVIKQDLTAGWPPGAS